MKRLLSALLIALFAVCALTGCGSGETRPEPEVTAEPTNKPEVTAEPSDEPEVTAEPTESAEKDGALTIGPIEGASSEPAAEGVESLDKYYEVDENEVLTIEWGQNGEFLHCFSFICGEAGPAEARGEGRGVTVSIVNLETMDQLESRVLADPADIAYLSRHIAEAEYRPVTDDEPELAIEPSVRITINVYKADGTEDHFRFTKNGYIAHSTEPFSAAADLDKAEHVSLEPVEDVVRMHAAAIASHNMYAKISDAGDPFNRSWLRDEDTSTLEIKIESAEGGEKMIEGDEAIAFGELIPNLPYTGTLIGSGYTIPEGAVRIRAIIKNTQHWDDLIWTEFYLTPEGRMIRLIRICDGIHFCDLTEDGDFIADDGALKTTTGFAVEYDQLFPEAAAYANQWS